MRSISLSSKSTANGDRPTEGPQAAGERAPRGPDERRPEWLKVRLRDVNAVARMRPVLKGLHTVCESARCPNIGECWGRGTATFMILGNLCTRRCSFCAVPQGKPEPPDPGEPGRVGQAVRELGLKHVVITSVTRDDLDDQGAGQFAACIEHIRANDPEASVEILIPDFQGRWDALDIVMQARPEVLNHNIETVPRLYRRVRPYARYKQSLDLLQRARRYGTSKVKSGFMVGLGETREEIFATLEDLRAHDVEIVTIGQYLKPRDHRIPMFRYVRPAEFEEFRDAGLAMGFTHVESGPLVRSSYHAEAHVDRALK